MTHAAFASLGPSTFNRLVRARQNVVALGKAYDAAEDTCSCPGTVRRCSCPAAPMIAAAWKAYQQAGDDQAEQERSWADYCAIRYAA